MDTNKYSASIEDYLEAIYNIISKQKAVRVKNIAQRLKVSNASVSGALRNMEEQKLINYAPYDVISLTTEGQKIALDVIRRHDVLRDFFQNILGLEYKESDETACKVEHAISRNVLKHLERFMVFCSREDKGMARSIQKFKALLK